MKPPISILLIEDDPNDAKLLSIELDKHYSAAIRRVQNEKEYRAALSEYVPDIILSDYNLPVFDGMKALTIRQQIASDIPFVLVTGSINESTAVNCMKAGADDYIIKEHLHRLVPAMEAAIEKQKLIKGKQAFEIALRTSEERFRYALDNSPVTVFTQDRSLRYTWLYHPVTTFDVNTVIGKTDADLLPADEAALLTLMKQKVIDEGETIRETVKTTVKGKQYYNDLTIEPLFDDNGTVKGITCTSVDITEQIVAKNALRESEKRFRSIFQDNLAVMFLIDPVNGSIVDANEAAVRFYGWTRARLLSMRMDEINTIPREELMKEMENARLRKRVYFEFRHRLADGSIRDVQVFTSKIEISGKEYLHIIIHDVSDRKKTEEKLLLHTMALQSAANAVIITDMHGMIISVNPAFTTLTGYLPDEVIGQKTSILKSGMQNEQYYKHMWETITSGRVWRNEIVNKRKNGSLYTEEMTVTPVINDQGVITNFIAIKQDVTEQKNLQQQLFQAQKVESIGTLAGGIAHDFNNILGIILAYSTLLQRGPVDTAKLQESLGAITKAVNRGAALVKQILTFARKSDVSFKSVKVSGLIRELNGMLQETFPKIITIKEDIPNEIPEIHADQTQLHQALLNLCVNARDAMPKGGELKIAVKILKREKVAKKFPEARYDRYIQISVADTGTGIDSATQKRIFDPFFTTKDVGKGTGMGLAVVTGVAQTHHGFVDVESTVGKGTTFYLYIPIPQEVLPNQDADPKVRRTVKGGQETILLVEDEELLRDVVTSMLTAKGYSVISAADGNEAVSLYRQNQNTIDLVFTDIGLPKLSGIEEFWALKKINPRVRVLLASGFLDPEIKSDLFDAGASGFVQKPYEAEDVLEKIRGAIDRLSPSAAG
jgi:two-component system cell cycle sensor histidine kinase/response regulator CckA